MLTIRRGVVIVILVALTSACRDGSATAGPAIGVASMAPVPVAAPAPAPGPTGPSLDELIARYPAHAQGLRTYRAQYCGTCHTFAPAATGGVFGPVHDGLRRTAETRLREPTYSGQATTPEEYVRESILRPGLYRVSGYEVTRFLMPAYTNLSESDVEALVHLLLDLDAGDD